MHETSVQIALMHGDIRARGIMHGTSAGGIMHAAAVQGGSMHGDVCAGDSRLRHAQASAMRASQRSGSSDEQLSGYGANLVFFHLFA